MTAPTRGRPKRLPGDLGEKLFRMVDSGVTVAAAANIVRISLAMAYRLLGAEEACQGRKPKRTARMRPTASGGDMRGRKRARGQGIHSNRDEILARLAIQLRAVTEEKHSVKARREAA